MLYAEMPICGTDSIGFPEPSTRRSSTVIIFKPSAFAFATMPGPSFTSGVQMMKPCAFCAARLSIALMTFSPDGAPIFTSVKPFSLAAISANFHSSWNQGSSGCFTRKPIFTSSAACATGALNSTPAAAAANVRKILRFMTCLLSGWKSSAACSSSGITHAAGAPSDFYAVRAGPPRADWGAPSEEALHGTGVSAKAPTPVDSEQGERGARLLSVVIERGAPAIDRDTARVDERRFVGSEKHRCHRHFVGPSDSFHRLQIERRLTRDGRVGLTVPPVERQLRLDVAGRDCVDAHLTRRVFDAERARETEHAMLGNRVREAPGNDLERMCRRDVHDAAAPTLDHARQHRAATVPDAVEVDREAAAPIVVGHRERIAEHVDAGVVDKRVERAEGALPFTHCALDRGGLRDVRLHREHACSGHRRFDFLRGAARFIDIEFSQHDRRALSGERVRDRRTDTAAGTGDQRDLVRQTPHDAARPPRGLPSGAGSAPRAASAPLRGALHGTGVTAKALTPADSER